MDNGMLTLLSCRFWYAEGHDEFYAKSNLGSLEGFKGGLSRVLCVCERKQRNKPS